MGKENQRLEVHKVYKRLENLLGETVVAEPIQKLIRALVVSICDEVNLVLKENQKGRQDGRSN